MGTLRPKYLLYGYMEPLGIRDQDRHETRYRQLPATARAPRSFKNVGVSENRGTLFGGPYNKDPTI